MIKCKRQNFSPTTVCPGNITNTVKPAYVVISIKQSHVLKGHIFLVLS